MRTKFDEQLEILNNDLISMGAMCEESIACAVKALLKRDMRLANIALKIAPEIDQKEKDIEAYCLKLLLQQQPVARDLRLISSALKMITDMERIGNQAADIAEIVTFVDLSEDVNNMGLEDMAKAAIKMVTDSIDAFVRRDLELSNEVIKYDDIVDGHFVRIKKDLIDLIAADRENGEKALDILMIAKYLERIADHAALIAEWVAFSITGTHQTI